MPVIDCTPPPPPEHNLLGAYVPLAYTVGFGTASLILLASRQNCLRTTPTVSRDQHSDDMYGNRQLAYAPTPYIPRSALSATINLDEEVKLSTTSTERDLYDSLAEIYSIIITLDALEKAYLKDSIAEGDYTDTCSRLLKQYKSNLADETVARAFGDLETFKREWDVRGAVVLLYRPS